METEVRDLVPAMFGTSAHRGWSLLGGETNTFLRFAAAHLVEKYDDRIPRLALWSRPLRGLLRFNEQAHEHQLTFSLPGIAWLLCLETQGHFHWR